ncbi:hypothetical protein B0H14DRAFT_2647982 [Mycena olivaceomarginata]|nr:hypothetical protein B0H14DRAFT_2647982 [Mycena olivaceomarginata]
MAIRWRMKRNVRVTIISFSDFRSLCLSIPKMLEENAAQYDLVFGGAEYTIDGVEEDHFEDAKTEQLYIERMTNLSRVTTVWPRPESSWAARFKFEAVKELDWIAEAVTHSNRPRTALLSNPDQYTEGIVIKREASFSPDAIFEMVAHNKSSPNRWFAQDINPELRRVGEVRCMVLGIETGDDLSFHFVATTPVDELHNVMEFQECTANYALEDLQGSNLVKSPMGVAGMVLLPESCGTFWRAPVLDS